jgi:hypothetical protein
VGIGSPPVANASRVNIFVKLRLWRQRPNGGTCRRLLRDQR